MVAHQPDDLIKKLRNFEGLTRKSALGEILNILKEEAYDDAGFFDVGEFKVVVSCDGIVESFVKSNPFLAGYYSVLVNVNDVVAKGARPIGFINIISSSSSEVRRKLAEGIRDGLSKYKLKLLKGHMHPDTSYDCVDAAAIGIAKNVLPSTAAKVGDSLIIAVDLVGKFRAKGWLKTFDTTTMKPSQEVLNRLNSVIEIAERGLAHAARDISGPGIMGTLAMLCESSQIGSKVDLGSIPKPADVKLEDWLTTYPGIGFIISTNQPIECMELLRRHKLATAIIGEIIKGKEIWLFYNKQRALFLDLKRESIFGVSSHE
jgi:hypothetical protein